MRIADLKTQTIRNPCLPSGQRGRQAKSKIRNSSRSSSSSLLEEARRYLVGGVNSPVRAFRAVGETPLILTRGRGARVADSTGRSFVDFIMGWGTLILGHAHPRVVTCIRRCCQQGTLLGLTTPAEVELAKTIVEAFPSVDHVRLTPSGTEACMTAIRLARAATGRSKLLTFEGCYHGHSDGLLVKRGSPARHSRQPGRAGLATLGLAKSAGVPDAVAQETIVIPYNDRAALDEAIGRYGHELAGVIIEPVAANMGVVVPDRRFLAHLRSTATACGIVLIFDEVVTGFRVAYGGAQTRVGVIPDLTVLGKIIGGGFPIGAIAGPRHLMARLAPEGPVYHAGTFAGHPLAMAAGLATLRELKRQGVYETLESLGAQLATGLSDVASRADMPLQVNRVGSMLTVFFSDSPVEQFHDAEQANATRFAQMANGLRKAGILIPPSPFEALFLATVHTPAMIDRVITAFSDACTQIQSRSPR